MTTRIKLTHHSEYKYDRPTVLGPQIIRLRPAPQCRTEIISYALNVDTGKHFLNWQQDVYGNHLARVVVPNQTEHFDVTVELVANLTDINPFDFFLDPEVEQYPFSYPEDLQQDLGTLLGSKVPKVDSTVARYLKTVNYQSRSTIDFLIDLVKKIKEDIRYTRRMETGVQSADETLNKESGSCRDSAWLLVEILRQLGFAARFCSGYLIQLVDEGEQGEDEQDALEEDTADLHAWTEVFLPGAGWIGMDATSGLLAGAGHIPLAATPAPSGSAPISGTSSESKCDFEYQMTLSRETES